MENMEFWNKAKSPPQAVLKKITGGRLSGMIDIKPQWRYQVMTEQFCPCGIGWKYDIVKLWNETGSESQVLCFALVSLYVKDSTGWSDSIPGIGGSMMVAKEKNGMHSSDECYKMAVTDALSTAMQKIGVAADVYMGENTGSKYNKPDNADTRPQPDLSGNGTISSAQLKRLQAIRTAHKWTDAACKKVIAEKGYGSSIQIKIKDYDAICKCFGIDMPENLKENN